jgi:hypothetical protein
MAGGIQVGSEAGSVESKQLDGDVKNIAMAIAVFQEKYCFELGHQKNKILPECHKMNVTLGCVPDGGMWFDGSRNQPRTVKAVFEAKHQQDGGNAIERWCKNYLICYRLNPDVKYITFMTGEGAQPGGVLYEFGQTMRAINGDNCIFYYQPAGFTEEEIFNIMIGILGLDIPFEKIKTYLNINNGNSSKSSSVDFFVKNFETEEERAKRIAEENERRALEMRFSTFAQTPGDPLYAVWHRLPRADLAEAHDIVLEEMQAGKANAEIATTLVECFLN